MPVCWLYSICFHQLEDSRESGVGGCRRENYERSNGEQREGMRRAERRSQVYLSFALQADQVSVAPCWVVLHNLALRLQNRFSSSFSPSPRIATINTQRTENRPKMTTPRAAAHENQREGNKKRVWEPERCTGEPVFWRCRCRIWVTARLHSPFGSILTLSAFYLCSPSLTCAAPYFCRFAVFPALPSHPREVEQKPAALQPSVFHILTFVLQRSATKQMPGKVCLQPDYWPVYQARDHDLRVSVQFSDFFWKLGSNFLLFSEHLAKIK